MLHELKFKILSQRHSDDVFRFALAMLGNHADAQDVTQDVLIKLWHMLPGLSLKNVRSWIMVCARNRCLDHIRRMNRHSNVPIEDLDKDESWNEPNARSVSTDPDGKHLFKEMNLALGCLNEKQRSAFVLYEINGMKYKEIAQALDLPVNSVKVYILRARKQLQKHLTQNASWIKNYIDGSN